MHWPIMEKNCYTPKIEDSYILKVFQPHFNHSTDNIQAVTDLYMHENSDLP